MTLRCAVLHAQTALSCWLPCNYLTALTEFRNREKPQSHLGDLEEGREMKRHSKNADSPVLNLPWPVCGKGRAAGLAGAGRAIPGLGLGSWTRPTLHRPHSEGVAPKFHVLREGTMARGSATSSGCRATCGENKGRGVRVQEAWVAHKLWRPEGSASKGPLLLTIAAPSVATPKGPGLAGGCSVLTMAFPSGTGASQCVGHLL